MCTRLAATSAGVGQATAERTAAAAAASASRRARTSPGPSGAGPPTSVRSAVLCSRQASPASAREGTQRRHHSRRAVASSPTPAEVAASLVHMHCNRLLGIDRAAERRVLGLLYRVRDSLAKAPVA